MTWYNVSVVTAPIDDDDWSALRRLTDLVPGTILLEDPLEPLLIFPVSEENQGRAYLFVDGILKLVGVTPVKGEIEEGPVEAEDFQSDCQETAPTLPEATRRVAEWMEQVPQSPAACH
ncbi:hypothetical protein [Tomitella gaofuii]|uniref:hypothetical protein n=1 Tax=Tomitella gaofuii TaxID=2760083 RepID=UPI0015FCF68B|nr:hypothetical protein [Tomitella gaofuii]